MLFRTLFIIAVPPEIPVVPQYHVLRLSRTHPLMRHLKPVLAHGAAFDRAAIFSVTV
jgi:hypothetical protein